MHAYLIVGQTNDNFDSEVESLAKKIPAKVMDFPLQKIDDVRSLNSLIRLSFSTPTLIVAKNIHLAGEEALNALLKNLEEPQENIYFALTAPSDHAVLPTIVSRCQIVKTVNSVKEIVNESESDKFVAMTKSEKLTVLDKIKDREAAINFIENLIFFLHSRQDFTNMETVNTTLVNLKKNGNVSLHLTNLVVMLKEL
jgi:DNA polymerase III delta prime subunit